MSRERERKRKSAKTIRKYFTFLYDNSQDNCNFLSLSLFLNSFFPPLSRLRFSQYLRLATQQLASCYESFRDWTRVCQLGRLSRSWQAVYLSVIPVPFNRSSFRVKRKNIDRDRGEFIRREIQLLKIAEFQLTVAKHAIARCACRGIIRTGRFHRLCRLWKIMSSERSW